MKSRFLWLLVRCLVAVFFASAWPSLLNDAKMPPQNFPFWGFLFVLVFGSIAIMSIFRSQIRSEMKQGKLKDWSRPSWFSNPFLGQPHFMHMGANAFVITGLVGLIQSALSGEVMLMNLFPLVVGWSILLGSTLFYEFIFDRVKANTNQA